MKIIILASILTISTSLFASDKTSELEQFLANEDNLSHELMWSSGRIGELYTSAKIVKGKSLNSVLDDEIAHMVRNEELFRHEDDVVITDFASLLTSESYKVIYKTGQYRRNNYGVYDTDGIAKDLLGIVVNQKRLDLQYLLDETEFSYLRTWTRASEYDGMEKFIIKTEDERFVILTIDNCGGC
jgi:hypothetical protein